MTFLPRALLISRFQSSVLGQPNREGRRMETLQEFIQANMEPILMEWEKYARTLIPGLDVAILRDHAQDILETIVRDMNVTETSEEQQSKSRGEGPENKPSRYFSQKHASSRLDVGYDLQQLISEYRALRASVIRLWTAEMKNAEQDQLYQLTRFNEALDQALTYTVQEFGKLVENNQAEVSQKLHESEERYRSLAEVGPDAMLVSLDGRFAYANPAAARLLGAENASQVVGLSALDFLDARHHDLARDRIRRVLEKGEMLPGAEYRLRRLDGTHLDTEATSSPIKWNGKPAIQIVARDITQRKRMEKELREADQHKEEFLATLAHELRNPLAPIQTGIEILRLTKFEPHAAEDFLDMMERQMAHLVRLVDDLLDVSRISRGKVILRKENVDVREAISKALEATSAFTNAGGRQVSVGYPARPLTVKADPVRLVQIIANLLSNAGKYTSEHGNIWISGIQEGEHVKISVRDDGVGMTPEAQQRLFQMFMQVDPQRAGGLGVGLALVRSLVELHGGTVEAFSEGLDKGSEFIVCLPLSRQGSMEKPRNAHSRLPAMNGKRVMIVDDNKDAARSLAMLLSLAGADVSVANEGSQAVIDFQEYAPDLVLLDLGMPGMDGYEVARRIRKMPEGRHVQLLAVTGWGQEEDKRRTRQAGFDGHLVKPVEMKDLERVLTKLGDLRTPPART